MDLKGISVWSVTINWPLLLLGAFLTLSLGLGTHIVLITYFHVPYPYSQPNFSILKYTNQVAIAIGAILLYRKSVLFASGLSVMTKIFVFFLLLTTTTERLLRSPLMDGFVTTAWIYSFISNFPKLASWLVLASLIAPTARFLSSWMKVALAAIGYATIANVIVGPAVIHLYQPILAAAASLQHDAIYGFPYGWQVTSAAYVTYIEPVVSCLVVAAITWEKLSDRTVWKIVSLTLLIAVVRGSLLSPIAYAAFHSDHWWAAFVSDGQFTLESIVLGFLTALTWNASLMSPLKTSETDATTNNDGGLGA